MSQEQSTAAPGSLVVIEFQQFDTTFAVRPNEEEGAKRRFMTLISEPTGTPDRLYQNEVLHVTNTEGEHFALKRIRPLPGDVDPAARRGREAALFEEYRNQLIVSHLQGFPRVYGYGVTREGDPAILMEWVDGVTLQQALEKGMLPKSPLGKGGIASVAVASLATSVLQTLVSTTFLEGTFAHRDISTRNIMLRLKPAGHRPGAPEKAPAGWGVTVPLETCLIDLGSAIIMRRDEATFTMTMDVWRNATPEYAPPEMLALNDRSYMEARRSPSIDVYALCSVLYQLYSGTAPFNVAAQPVSSAFELKTQGAPQVPQLQAPEDAPLVQAIMAGLAVPQDERPTARDLLDRISAWRESVTGQATEKRDMPSAPQTRGTHLTALVSAMPSQTEARQTQTKIRTDGPAPAVAAEAPKRRSISRRGFIVGATCVGAAAVGGALWGVNFTATGRAWKFGQQSWDSLADLADRISAAGSREEALAIAVDAGIANEDGSMVDGLTKKVTLADGTSSAVQLVDFWHDDRTDGVGKAGLTFAFTSPLAERPMSSTSMDTGGWKQCDMRAWLNAELLDALPEDLADYIRPVQKLTNNVGSTRDATSVTATSDSLWLFSVAEMGGTRTPESFSADFHYLADILNAEGEQYQLWKDKHVNAISANNSLVRQWQGNPCYWWNRSPSPDCSEDYGQTWFNRVGANGDVFHFAAPATGDQNAAYVLPGFCL